MHEAAHGETPAGPAASSSQPEASETARVRELARPSPSTGPWVGQADGDPAGELSSAYAKAVRASGGFPDVKISALRGVLSLDKARTLDQTLRALWQAGRVTLSLGDWSLASEETRAAAVELDGERYLLVRFEDPAAAPLSA